MKKYVLFAMVVTALITVAGCSDDDIPALEYSTQGEIKGTIKGTRRNEDVTFEETFAYSRYQKTEGDHSRYYLHTDLGAPGDEGISINVYRGDMTLGGFVRLSVDMDNATDSTPNVRANVSFVKEDKQIFVFTAVADMNEYADDLKVTNFSFDQPSGRLRGDFSFATPYNSTTKDAEVTFSVDVVVKREIL
jgi:hypothetical protein